MLAVLCSAAPSDKLPVKPFSFEQWAREISENPTGHHLSPEEAIAAYNATVAAAASNLESRGADPQVTCSTYKQCYVSSLSTQEYISAFFSNNNAN